MSAVANLAAFRRRDRVSSAISLIVMRALGMTRGPSSPAPVPDHVVFGHRRFDLVSARIEVACSIMGSCAQLSIFTRPAFLLSMASVASVLGDVDAGATPADAWPPYTGLGLDNVYSDEAKVLVDLVYSEDDGRRRDRLLQEVWKEVGAFIMREWSQIEALAKRLDHGAVAASEIPQLAWKVPKTRRPRATRLTVAREVIASTRATLSKETP